MDQDLQNALDVIRADIAGQLRQIRTDLIGELREVSTEIRRALSRVDEHTKSVGPATQSLVGNRDGSVREMLAHLRNDVQRLGDRYATLNELFLHDFTDLRRWIQRRLDENLPRERSTRVDRDEQ